jgi:hypothetical protein
MNIKKEYLIGGLIVVGVALYLISQGDGVLNSASNNKGENLKIFREKMIHTRTWRWKMYFPQLAH